MYVIASFGVAFLLVRGLFNRSFAQIVVAAVLFFYWGSVLWGALPGNPEISWQGHLFGALGGILAGWLAATGGTELAFAVAGAVTALVALLALPQLPRVRAELRLTSPS